MNTIAAPRGTKIWVGKEQRFYIVLALQFADDDSPNYDYAIAENGKYYRWDYEENQLSVDHDLYFGSGG